MNNKKKDAAAFRELMSDIIVEVLKYAGNPGQCGEYVTQQIRELVGVRFVLLAEFSQSGTEKIVPISFCPARKASIWQNEEFRRFVSLAADFNAPAHIIAGTAGIGAVAERLGFRESFVAPLNTGFERIGMLLLVDLMEPAGSGAVLDALKQVSGAVALVLRNALFYRKLEHLVSERAQALEEKESRLRFALEATNDGIWDVQMTTGEVYLSPRGCEILGYRPDEAAHVIKVWNQLVHPDDMPETLEHLNAHIEGRTPLFMIEQRLRTKSGDWKWILTRGKIVARDQHGKALRITGTHTDIGTRKAAETSLRFTQFAVDHAGEAIYWVDANARFLYANEHAVHALGYPLAELRTMSLFDIDSKYGPAEWEDFLPALQTRGSLIFESLHRKKDGGTFPVEMNVTHMEFEGNTYICGFARDITERKRIEKEMSQWMQLFERADFGLAIFNAVDNNISAVNPAFARERGYTETELAGRSILTIYPPDRYEETRRRIESFATVNHAVFESEHQRKDGSRFPVLMEVTVIRDSTGVPVSRVAYALDITSRKQAEEERERLQKQLIQSQKMEAIGILAGGVAHDFNNILQGIIVNLDLLKLRHPVGGIKESVDDIMTLSFKAAELTKGMLAYSRQQIFALKSVNTNEVVQRAARLLSRMLGEDIEVSENYCKEPLTACLDSGQIQQVILNLAANARDAMPVGGVLHIETARVEISAEQASEYGIEQLGSYAVISVTDSGSGISRKDLVHIFDPFYTTKEVGKGTGLGLAIVFGIVKQHNGTITVYSEEGKGTTFSIYLPLHTGEPTTPELPPEPRALEGGQGCIMLLEDDLLVNTSMQQLLAALGYQVTAFVHAQDALDEFAQSGAAVDLVILDVIMPNKGGKEVLAEMRRIRPDIRALFISGYPADFLDKKGLIETGFHLLMKPVMPQTLSEKIKSILGS